MIRPTIISRFTIELRPGLQLYKPTPNMHEQYKYNKIGTLSWLVLNVYFSLLIHFFISYSTYSILNNFSCKNKFTRWHRYAMYAMVDVVGIDGNRNLKCFLT